MVGYGGKDLQKRKVFSLEWKSKGVIDDESGEMELMEEVPLEELGEAELKRLVRGWRRGAGSWFQRRGGAYWKERYVIRKEDDVDEWASVTNDKERVVRGGWTVMRLCRYEGWVVVKSLRGAYIQSAQLSLTSAVRKLCCYEVYLWDCNSVLYVVARRLLDLKMHLFACC